MIGKKLKTYRLNLNLTGEKLANLAGIQRSYLSQIENEKKVPPFDTFMNLVTAISKISPLNPKNQNSVLTEENFNKFLDSASIKAYEIPEYPDKISISVTFESISDELGFIFDKDTDNLNYEPMEPFKVGKEINSKPFIPQVQNELNYYFFNTNDDNPIYDSIENLSESVLFELNEISLYDFSFIRESLFQWWYNHILQDFVGNDKIDIKNTNFIQENELLISVSSLENDRGFFSPTEKDNSVNLSKELLDGKTITIDLRSTTDKNIKLLLDGQLLSNDELTALKFTLNGIRYNRQTSNQLGYFERKRQKLIDEGYFDDNK